MFYNRGRGGRARAAKHPRWRLRLWAKRAAAIRWNPVRLARGLAPLPVPEVLPVRTERADEMRRRRELGKRRAAFAGVPYHDSMASDPAIRRALEADTPARELIDRRESTFNVSTGNMVTRPDGDDE
jgi:hypothetical protein